MIQELIALARALTGVLAMLTFCVGAAAVVGLTLLAAGSPPPVAAAGALATPTVCGVAIGIAVRGARVGPTTLAATLSVGHALLPVSRCH